VLVEKFVTPRLRLIEPANGSLEITKRTTDLMNIAGHGAVPNPFGLLCSRLLFR
jgi:hypothetical protein